MKRMLALVLVISLTLAGCTPYVTSEEDEWGIYLSAKDITPTGLTLLIEQKGGYPSGELTTGSWFKLEKKTEDDWVEVSTNPLIDYAWTMVAYQIKKDDVTEFSVEWEWLYGILKPGTYRLTKEITDLKVAGVFDKKIYTYEFCIEKTDKQIRCPVGEDIE